MPGRGICISEEEPSLDYLLEQNSLEPVKDFVSELEAELRSNDAYLILSGEPKNIDETDLREFKRIVSDISAGVFSEALSNHIRRRVISQLYKKGGISFTTLSRRTGVTDSAKISFHLRRLESWGLIEKDEEKRYRLTTSGKNAAETLKQTRGLQEKGLGRVSWLPR